MGGSNNLDAPALSPRGERKDDLVQSLLSSLQNEATQENIRDCSSINHAEREDELPIWFDEERYIRGAETFEKNIFLMFMGKMSGLLTLLAIPSIVKVLVLTKQSGEAHKAFRRYVDTIRHMLFWYRSCLKDPKSLSRDSLKVVRNHHLRAAAAAQRGGMAGITQFDLAITQFAFCGYIVLRRKQLGLDANDQQILDFVHVWKTLGFMIGIKDRFNLCQFDCDIERTDNVFEGVCSNWLGPALTSPPEEFWSMSRALMDGAWCMMPVLEYNSFLHFTQELAGLPEEQRCQQPKAYSSIMLALTHLVPNTMTWPILGRFFRAYHNANMHFSLYMSTYYPLLAWYSFPGNSSTRYHKLVPNED